MAERVDWKEEGQDVKKGGWVGGRKDGRRPFSHPPTWQNLVYAAEAMAFRMKMLCGPDLIASSISEKSGGWLLSLSLR
jgi:hypothetical protein